MTQIWTYSKDRTEDFKHRTGTILLFDGLSQDSGLGLHDGLGPGGPVGLHRVLRTISEGEGRV